ncbi:MAG: helix-turn-helix transcriptional regulator [Coriobacteriales bacterium]|nr:helix-turn-helix transcriptional regulator [Coriobacteriales bacterium]
MAALRRPDRERPLYMISVAAELAGVHPQTLRIYERKQLICPQRSSGNTRLYSDADIERLRLIQQLTQEEGVNLAGVERIIAMQQQLERMHAELEAMRVQLARVQNQMNARRQPVVGMVHVQRGQIARRSGGSR